MSDPESKNEEKKLVTIKNAADLQRLKIEKLMKNPEKPVVIPERPKQKALAAPPDFVRNVMGSSAGAGSGEFHVYRHLRRKEYARQKFIQEKSEKEKLDEEYHMKIERNKQAVEEKTAKKRAKRLRKKRNAKLKGKQPKKALNQQNVSSQTSDSSTEDDEKAEINLKADTDVKLETNVKADCNVKMESNVKSQSPVKNETDVKNQGTSEEVEEHKVDIKSDKKELQANIQETNGNNSEKADEINRESEVKIDRNLENISQSQCKEENESL